MIKVIVRKNGIEIQGHANYGARGNDIVCAAASGIIQTAVLGMMKHMPNVQIAKNDGYIKINDNSHIIIDTMMMGLKDLEIQFPKHIQIKEERT